MTLTSVDLDELAGNLFAAEHPDQLREILANALAEVMNAEANRLCGAGYAERSTDRQNQRNGYRVRPFETRLGSIDLHIPKLRQGSYLPSFLNPRRRWEKAFVNVVSEAYVLGVSTRKVEELVEAMGATGMSKSEVSRMAKSLDAQVQQFRERRLDEKRYPYVWLDAMYVKVREDAHVRSRAVLVAIAVNESGDREVIGVRVADKEMEQSWRSFLASLVERGLRGVKLVISDAHEGLQKAIPAVFNGVTWQRCYVHFIRNVMDKVPRKARNFVAAALRNVFAQPDREHADLAMNQALELLEPKYSRAADVVRAAEEDVLAHYAFPSTHRKQIRSTNPLERLNKEMRRRERVVGIFPNRASVLRLLGMILNEQHDEWQVRSRCYFSAKSMKAVLDAPALLELGEAAK